jgi:hypothetical protein
MTDEAPETRKRVVAMLRMLKWQRLVSPSAIAAWTVLVALVGGLISGYEWIETRKFEARKPFLEARLKAYVEAIQVAGAITDAKLNTASDVWKNNAERFISMRWGELEMLGDAGIRNAARLVTEYIRETERPESKFDRHNLRWAIECLADELRFSLENDWGQIDTKRKSIITETSVSSLPEGCTDSGLSAARRKGMPATTNQNPQSGTEGVAN